MSVSERERNNRAIDMLIALTVDEISERLGRDPIDVMPEFIGSRTARVLYDESTKLWWDGPSAIAEMYLEEKGLKNGEN